MKLACIGDSLTTGFGVFRNERWTEILKDKYGLDVVNKGVNGDTTAGMLDRFHDDVVLSGATHVIIMGGCNDLMSNRELENVKENIRLMAEEAKDNGILPVLAAEPPIIPDMAKRKWSWDADYDYAVGNSLLLRDWLLGFCSENSIECIDLYGLFENELKSLSANELYIDGLHPRKLGHELIAEEVARALMN
ncbi:MAG: TesA-like protease [Firmicutes bacterium]|nr:TesA-like protease [Bacillota bacterium]